jgi:hypothetical protein
MGIESLSQDIANVGTKSIQIISANPVGTAVGAAIGGAVIGGAVTGLVVSASKKRSKSRSRRKRTGRSRDRLFKSKQKHERRYKRKRKYKVYGKRGYISPKKSSKRRGKIHYAKKTGQPYIILASGKAKFIKGKRRK